MFAELFSPYCPADYRGVLDEFISRHAGKLENLNLGNGKVNGHTDGHVNGNAI